VQNLKAYSKYECVQHRAAGTESSLVFPISNFAMQNKDMKKRRFEYWLKKARIFICAHKKINSTINPKIDTKIDAKK